MRAFSRGEPAVSLIYSRNHCFVRIPREAETRLKTRLENHMMLMRTERESAWKDCVVVIGVVELDPPN